MSDFNYPQYEQAKRQYGKQFAASSARNAYSRFLAQQRGERQKFDIEKAYKQQMPRFISQYTRRGLAGPGIKSGIYTGALQNQLQEQYDTQQRAQQDMLDSLRQADLTAADLEEEYKSQLAELEAQKQGEIARTASMLQSFRPFLGG